MFSLQLNRFHRPESPFFRFGLSILCATTEIYDFDHIGQLSNYYIYVVDSRAVSFKRLLSRGQVTLSKLLSG